MEFSEKPFKVYDIRGVYPSEINEETAYRVGRAFVKLLGAKKVVVGRDARVSSVSLFRSLAKGIADQGADVLDIGLCTTPMVSFCVADGRRYGVDAGIMISASHNPSQYNAFKLIRARALQMYGDSLSKIRGLCVKNSFKDGKRGKVVRKDLLKDYLAHVSRFAEGVGGLKIVCDYGNGVGSISASPLLKRLPIKVVSMYEKVDGTFPNHPANPHDIENMDEIRKRVVKERADAGFFFDGDADRAVVIDDRGEIIFPDLLLALLVEKELELFPAEKVYFDLRFSRVVPDTIKKYGGVPVMMKVGNPFYKEKLILEGGALGGEFSGHMMFRENSFVDDGLFAAVKVLSLLSRKRRRLSELIKPLRVYSSTPEINIKVESMDSADRIIAKIRKEFRREKQLDLDGLTVDSKDWWFNLRRSNTEPLIRLRVEARTAKMRDGLKERVMGMIEPC